MVKKKESMLKMHTLDDLFSTEEMRREDALSKIRDIPISEIDEFPEHPFQVRDDEDMMQLAESIRERGVLTPATVRKKEDWNFIRNTEKKTGSGSNAAISFSGL